MNQRLLIIAGAMFAFVLVFLGSVFAKMQERPAQVINGSAVTLPNTLSESQNAISVSSEMSVPPQSADKTNPPTHSVQGQEQQRDDEHEYREHHKRKKHHEFKAHDDNYEENENV